MELFKVLLKHSQNGYFFLFLFTSGILLFKLFDTTRRAFKFVMNKAPLVLIFFQGLDITCKIYYNLSIKGEKYQSDYSTSLM